MKVLASGEQQITLYYGNQMLNGKPYYHTGIDLVRQTNRLDAIVAAEKGKVIKVVSNVKGRDTSKGYGNYVELQHGNNMVTKYCHLKYGSIKVKVGQIVSKAQEIGYMGDTGYTFGAHLHFQIIQKGSTVDPLPYLKDQKKITPYKDQILNNNMTFHEILTLASIVELEGITLDDRKNITSVFINRINSNMSLGSDVTTYYGVKVDMGERDLYTEELEACNNYNTRCITFKGLPIAPISNPSLESIESVISPINTNYYYFVADKNKKIYFSETIEEHNNTINRLKNNNLWFEY